MIDERLASWPSVAISPKGFPSPESFPSLSGGHFVRLACGEQGVTSISSRAPGPTPGRGVLTIEGATWCRST